MSSDIEWTDETWNPTVGCSKVSPGCDGCYAIGVAARQMQDAHRGLTIRTPSGVDWTGEVRQLPDRLDTPLRWRKPRRVFVDSMSDLFHRDVPASFVARVFSTMDEARKHTFQVLTKRPHRMRRLLDHGGDVRLDLDEMRDALASVGGAVQLDWPLPNVWLGTSIESDWYTFRADHLRNTPAAVRFLSLEPLLGPLPSLDLTGIDWVIVGGESGPSARPMHPQWVREIRDRCVDAGVAFFFKQWGAWRPYERGDDVSPRRTFCDDLGTGTLVSMHKAGKHAAGRELDGRTWDEMPG